MEDLLSDLSELGIELEPDQLERFQNNLKINKTFASIAKSTSLLRNKKGKSQDSLAAFSGLLQMTRSFTNLYRYTTGESERCCEK